MKDEKIRKLWEDFVNDKNYSEYITLNNDLWCEKLKQLKDFMNKNKKRPLMQGNNINIEEKILGHWITTQFLNYKKKHMYYER